MNKLFAKIIAVALALTVIFSFTACKEVENGSKIERIVITLSLQDADSAEPTVYEVEAKLYVNFAPATVEHVKTLIKNGHYNNVDISAANGIMPVVPVHIIHHFFPADFSLLITRQFFGVQHQFFGQLLRKDRHYSQAAADVDIRGELHLIAGIDITQIHGQRKSGWPALFASK